MANNLPHIVPNHLKSTWNLSLVCPKTEAQITCSLYAVFTTAHKPHINCTQTAYQLQTKHSKTATKLHLKIVKKNTCKQEEKLHRYHMHISTTNCSYNCFCFLCKLFQQVMQLHMTVIASRWKAYKWNNEVTIHYIYMCIYIYTSVSLSALSIYIYMYI